MRCFCCSEEDDDDDDGSVRGHKIEFGSPR
jgi:hypothetical protein